MQIKIHYEKKKKKKKKKSGERIINLCYIVYWW